MKHKKLIYQQGIIDALSFPRYSIKMEYLKTMSLLDNISDNVPKFITKKWIEVHDQSGNENDRYKPSKQITFKTSMLQLDLCNYNDAYIVVKGTITLIDPNVAAYEKKLYFKNNALFSCISKFNNSLTYNADA